jgi:hypothetical protein
MREISMKSHVMALLVTGVLLLGASGPALAAGKLGGAGGADEFRTQRAVADGGKVGGGMDRPTADGIVTSGGAGPIDDVVGRND